MRPRSWRRLAWSLWAATVAVLAGAFVLGILAGLPTDEVVFAVLLPLLVLAFSTVGALVAAREPRNAIGWLFLCVALLWAVSVIGTGYAEYADARGWPLSTPVRAADWLGAWVFLPGIYLPVTFLLLLFPDGRLPSRRWRPVAWASAAGISALAAASALAPGPLEDAVVLRANPFAVGGAELWDVVGALSWPAAMAGLIGSVTALVVRFRRTSGDERQQVKWLAFASVAVAVLFVLIAIGWGLARDSEGANLLFQATTLVALLLVPAATGIAILRYRLYDIDVVVSKTLVYTGLVAFITVAYVAIVVGIGTLVGAGDEPNLGLSVAATALVAVAFQPARERLRRWANRLVYGERATPYEVLADFSHRMAATISIDDALPQMAEAAARGVGAARARVRLYLPDGLERSEVWPPVATAGGFAMAVEVHHQGAPVGEIAVAKDPGEPPTPAERDLLEALAAQAGLALHNVRLAVELRSKLDETTARTEALRSSRQRIVAARDVQRRRLEREIREGVQRRLAEVAAGLEEATELVTRDTDGAASLLERLGADAEATLTELRDLARGIFPPLLAEAGVVAALEAHVRKVGAKAMVEASPSVEGARFDPEVETCVYFCCVQAIQNVVRHADNAEATLVLDHDDGVIAFAIADEGPGFDAAATPEGLGLQIMRDRVEALDGSLEVRSAPGHGTTVVGRVPARALEAADR